MEISGNTINLKKLEKIRKFHKFDNMEQSGNLNTYLLNNCLYLIINDPSST